jgi:hypothetical protein
MIYTYKITKNTYHIDNQLQQDLWLRSHPLFVVLHFHWCYSENDSNCSILQYEKMYDELIFIDVIKNLTFLSEQYICKTGVIKRILFSISYPFEVFYQAHYSTHKSTEWKITSTHKVRRPLLVSPQCKKKMTREKTLFAYLSMFW